MKIVHDRETAARFHGQLSRAEREIEGVRIRTEAAESNGEISKDRVTALALEIEDLRRRVAALELGGPG